MAYEKSLTKKELLQLLADVPDDHEIFIVYKHKPLWLFEETVDVALESEEGTPVLLEQAIAIPACDEEWFD